MPCVYLLSINPPYQGKRHYIGYTRHSHPATRLAAHLTGRGSKFTGRVIRAGHSLELVCHWVGGDEKFERYLKERADTKLWCPHCKRFELPIPKLTDYDETLVQRYWEKHKTRVKQKMDLEELTMDRLFREQFGDGRWS